MTYYREKTGFKIQNSVIRRKQAIADRPLTVAMSERLAPTEVANLIWGKHLLREKGLSQDLDISRICKTAENSLFFQTRGNATTINSL